MCTSLFANNLIYTSSMNCFGICLIPLMATLAVSKRTHIYQHELSNSSQVEEKVEESGNLCEKSLIISYKQPEFKDGKEGLWVLEPGWEDIFIVEKNEGSGCSRTYTASCTKGMIVKKTCDGSLISTEYRCLGDGAGDCSFLTPNSYGTDLQTKKGELEMIVNDTGAGLVTLQGGRVSWEARDLTKASGTLLKPISKGAAGTTWSAANGCYCCKHSYPILHSPFCFLSSLNAQARVAWKVRDGTQECLNAWQYIGDDDVGMLIPDFLYMVVDTFSFGVTSSPACALACAYRDKSEFPEHSHYYMKSAIS